jgi:excisionase family DNA binding protein
MAPSPSSRKPSPDAEQVLARLDKAVREFGRLVGVRFAAQLVGVSERRVVQAIRDGELKATRLGKDYVVRVADLRRYVQRRRPRGRPRRGPGRPRKSET